MIHLPAQADNDDSSNSTNLTCKTGPGTEASHDQIDNDLPLLTTPTAASSDPTTPPTRLLPEGFTFVLDMVHIIMSVT